MGNIIFLKNYPEQQHVWIKIYREFYHGFVYITNEERHIRIYIEGVTRIRKSKNRLHNGQKN